MLQVPETLGLLEITSCRAVVDDFVSSIGYSWEAGDSPDCRDMFKDIDLVVHDDDDVGSAEAHCRVAGVPGSTRNVVHPMLDLSRLNIKPCISRESVLDVTMERRCISASDGAREQSLG